MANAKITEKPVSNDYTHLYGEYGGEVKRIPKAAVSSDKMDKVDPVGSGKIRFGENVSAVSPMSVAQGSGTTAGGKAFSVTAIGGTAASRQLTLDSVTGLAVGMLCSVYLKDVNDAKTTNIDGFGEITAINGTTVTFDKGFSWNYTLDSEQSSHMWVVGHPELGTRIIGDCAMAFGRDNIAQNEQTLVTGRENVAAGKYAVVNGRQNKGIGYTTHVEGRGNTVNGMYSSADGLNHTVDANYARAVGYNNEATGAATLAEGSGTHATHEGSHTEGLQTYSGNAYQHVEGKYNVQTSGAARVTGWGSKSGDTVTRKNIEMLDTNGNLRLKGDVYVGSTNSSSGGTKLAKITDMPDVSGKMDKMSPTGSGTFIMNDNSAGAKGWKWTAYSTSEGKPIFTISPTTNIEVGDRVSIKAGYSWNFFGTVTSKTSTTITVTQTGSMTWPENFTPANYIDSDNGYLWLPDKPAAGTFAIGESAVAFGTSNKANEIGSLVIGKRNVADGRYSFVTGTDNEGGYATLVQGDTNKASGICSMVVGQQSKASGSTSQAVGFGCEATGDYANASGHNSKAQADSSHAEGYATIASGVCAHAEGDTTTASGVASHAEGYNTTASGLRAHAEGSGTVADKAFSHAEGNGTLAHGGGSHAEGNGTQANHDYSHVEGLGTKTSATYQHVEGKYNDNTNSSFVHVIGGGTANNARKNLFAVSDTGGVAVKGDVYVHTNDNSSGGDKLATEAYVTTALAKSPIKYGAAGWEFYGDATSDGYLKIGIDTAEISLEVDTETSDTYIVISADHVWVPTPATSDEAANKGYVDTAISHTIPKTTVALGIINGIMTALVTKVAGSSAVNVATSINTTSDNTLHTTLDQIHNTYGNVLTEIKVGTTERTMLFKYDNHNSDGGIYSSDGFYVDEQTGLFLTYRMVVEWNRISAFVTKHTYVA